MNLRDHDPRRATEWRRTAVLLLGIPAAYVAVVLLLGLAASPDVGPGRCEGIGFGCTVAPRDGIWVLGFAGGVIGIPVYWLVLGIALWIRSLRSGRRNSSAARG